MADQQVEEEPPEIPLAPYPAPPPFWRAFTTHNLSNLKDVESRATDDRELPYSLALISPPPPPTTDVSLYKLFNVTHSLPPQPTLPPTDEERLIDFASLTTPSSSSNARPHARLLWQLTKSLSLNFLEFFTVMADNPVDWEEKWTDVGILLQNIHAVINVLRPHQAREQVKSMLIGRLEAGKEEIDRCDRIKAEIEDFLNRIEKEGTAERGNNETFSNGINGSHIQGKEDAEKRKKIESARRTWNVLDELDGD